MRAHRPSIILLALLVVTVSACSIDISVNSDHVDGSGTITSETRDLDDFDELLLAGEGTVTVFVGETPGIEIEGDDNLLEYIETEVRGDRLEIRTRGGIDIQPSDTIRYRVTTGAIEYLGLSGAGLIRVEALDTPRLVVTLTGAGNIEVDTLTAESVDVEITGAGLVRLGGETGELTLEMPGVGNFEGADLKVTEATVELPGVGSATLWVTDVLEADISGVGGISVWGDPTIVGADDVRRLGPR